MRDATTLARVADLLYAVPAGVLPVVHSRHLPAGSHCGTVKGALMPGDPRSGRRLAAWLALPPSFGRLPADDNWKDVRAAVLTRAASSVPTVFVSTVPAELILLRGTPETEPDVASRTGGDRPSGGGMRAGGGHRV